MKSITKQKPIEEIKSYVQPFDRLYIIGCGTCATMTKTGGVDQVREMQEIVKGFGKWVTGWAVLPTACDEMTEEDFRSAEEGLQYADCVLVMACALGVHRVTTDFSLPTIPALDTLFIGLEESPGHFQEVCAQCGQCVLGETAGICPLTACHKGLLNGPCGGTSHGKCEVDSEMDCAFTLIYERLKAQDRLDLMSKYHPPRNYHVTLVPKIISFTAEEGIDT